jgi:hypothetical protein
MAESAFDNFKILRSTKTFYIMHVAKLVLRQHGHKEPLEKHANRNL